MRCLIFAALAVSVVSLGAAPLESFDLRRLIANSEIVAVGYVESVEPRESTVVNSDGGQPAVLRWMQARMRVDRVLKGGASIDTLEIRFALSDSPAGSRGVSDGAYKMVFVRLNGAEYEFVSTHFPSLPATSGVPEESGNAEERVLGALAWIAQANLPSADKAEVIHALWGIDHPVVVAALGRVLQDPQPSISLAAAAALLAANQVVALPSAETELLQPDTSVDWPLIHNLRVAISEGVRNPSAIPSLTRLLTSDSVETRCGLDPLWWTSPEGWVRCPL